MRGTFCFRRAGDQISHTIHRRLQNIAYQIGYVRIARCFRVKVDNEGGDNSWLIFATMRGE